MLANVRNDISTRKAVRLNLPFEAVARQMKRIRSDELPKTRMISEGPGRRVEISGNVHRKFLSPSVLRTLVWNRIHQTVDTSLAPCHVA
jgi:hypothetical protein